MKPDSLTKAKVPVEAFEKSSGAIFFLGKIKPVGTYNPDVLKQHTAVTV
jgi:hypothetical protein